MDCILIDKDGNRHLDDDARRMGTTSLGAEAKPATATDNAPELLLSKPKLTRFKHKCNNLSNN
jgi:hypothetical protein